MELSPSGNDGLVRRGPYGYVTLGSPEFVHRYVLALMCVPVLGALNVDNVALNLAVVDDMDYVAYVTTSSDFETVLFTMLSYTMYSSGDVLLVVLWTLGQGIHHTILPSCSSFSGDFPCVLSL